MNNTGLKRHTVRLANHNDEWQIIAQKTIDELKAAAGNLVFEIEHVGSTAVKGLPAKPIIDIAIAVVTFDAMPGLIEIYTMLGYIYRGDSGEKGGHLFVWESETDIRTTHVHIVLSDGEQWKNFIKFRDILRKNAEIRNRYKELKEALSLRFKDDRRSYTAEKNEFISEILYDIND